MLTRPRHAEVHPSTCSCECPCLPLMLPTPRPSMAKHAMHQQSHGRISKTPTPLAAVTKNERAAWMPSQRACSITLLGQSISFWSHHMCDVLSDLLVGVVLAPVRRREELRKVLPALFRRVDSLRIRVDRVLVLESVLLSALQLPFYLHRRICLYMRTRHGSYAI